MTGPPSLSMPLPAPSLSWTIGSIVNAIFCECTLDWGALSCVNPGPFLLHVVSLHNMLTCQISYMMALGFQKHKIRRCQAFLWLRLKMGTASFPRVHMSHRPSSESISEETTKGKIGKGPSPETSYQGRSEGDTWEVIRRWGLNWIWNKRFIFEIGKAWGFK